MIFGPNPKNVKCQFIGKKNLANLIRILLKIQNKFFANKLPIDGTEFCQIHKIGKKKSFYKNCLLD